MNVNLFSPLTIGKITFKNRIVVSPMSQYIALNGYANDWHFAHLSRFALGGAGLIFTEATAIEARGRRTHGDLGLWEDGQIAELERIARFVEMQGAVPGIQLAHAGRKASERRPWHGETPVDREDERERNESPWQSIAPSDQVYGADWPPPKTMTSEDVQGVIAGFGAAARRARLAGLKVIDIYAGHGFLLHQFCSPLSNLRVDEYGGSFENRIRLSLQVVDAIRAEWPQEFPLMFRLSAVDWVDGGWSIEDSIALSTELKAHGVDVIDCTSGGIGGPQKPNRMPLAQGFQVPFADQIKKEAGINTIAVGFIWDATFADQIIREGRADLVALARELLNDPNWPLHAARELGFDTNFSLWHPQFGWWLERRERVLDKLKLRDTDFS
jgi:2,4-dienoyl-CoA reductase-like NADH-dependent reductase (Old Yellow Enzyme family)